jgi:chromosome segregation ATPase
MNAALELKLLNEDIKANLPKLQALARNMEKDAWSTDDVARGNPGIIPSSDAYNMLMRSKDDLIRDIADYVSKHDRLQAKIREDQDQYRSQQANLSKQITVHRREINDLIHECESYKRSAWKYRSRALEEESRLDYLIFQLESTKAAIGRHHVDKDAWMTEAFFLETNSDVQATMAKERLAEVMRLWLPHVSKEVDEVLASCPYPHPREPSSLGYEHFVAFCKIFESEDQ